MATLHQIRLRHYPLIIATFTMSWNGIADSFSNATYAVVAIYALTLYLRFGREYRLSHVLPILISIVIASVFSVMLGSKRFPQLRQLEDRYLSSWFYLSPISSTYEPIPDLIAGTKWILAILCYPYVVQIYKVMIPKLTYTLKIAWLAGVLINISIQILQTFNVDSFRTINSSASSVFDIRASGLATHPNALAITVCLSIPIVSNCLREYKSILQYPIFAFFAFSIFLTQSRAGLLVFVVGIFLIFYFKTSRLKLRIGLLFSLVVSILLGYFFGSLNLIASYTRFGSDNLSAVVSNQIRSSLLKFGLEVFKEYPIFGGGPSLIKVSHNIYLQLLSSVGFIGLLAFLNLFIFLFLKNWNSNYESSMTVFIFLLFGMFNNSIADFYLYFPLGLTFIMVHRNYERKTHFV